MRQTCFAHSRMSAIIPTKLYKSQKKCILYKEAQSGALPMFPDK